MTQRQWARIYLVMLIFTIGMFLAGCVAIVTIGNENSITTQDNDGATSLMPKKGLIAK